MVRSIDTCQNKVFSSFFCIHMLFTGFVQCSLRMLKLKSGGQTVYRKSYRKVTKLKPWVSLIGLLKSNIFGIENKLTQETQKDFSK